MKKDLFSQEKLDKAQENQFKTQQNPDEKGSQSEQQQLKQQQQELRKQIRQKKKERRNNAKMVVGTGFSFDITEFFKFQKKKQAQGKQPSMFKEISGGHLAWFILLYSVCNAAMIPPWIMSIAASKLLRISWRFLLQVFMGIPLILYQRRSATPEIAQKYTFKNIFNPKHFAKLYLSAFATSFWFTIVLTTFQWTYISHAMVLCALPNFFLSIGRSYRKANHELQPGGQVLVVLGILLIFQDSFSLVPEQQPPAAYNVINPFYLNKTWYQRIMADIVALGVAFCMSRFSMMTADLKNYYPPFLSMGLVNFIIMINMAFSAYFFNGATWDYDQKFGVFGIFSQLHFAGFMYMAIILCMGLLLSFLMISKLFPQPIIPALAMVLQPVISSLILNLVGVQGLPGPFACIGYIFVAPGVFLILVGQCMFQREQKAKQIKQKEQLQRLLEMKEIRKEQQSFKNTNQSPQSKPIPPNQIQNIIEFSPEKDKSKEHLKRSNSIQPSTDKAQNQQRKSGQQLQHKQGKRPGVIDQDLSDD